MKDLEIRSIQSELSNKDESRLIHGLAIPTESRSELLTEYGEKFYEVITRNAVNDDFITTQDIKLYINHDPSQGTYGRSKYGSGSLKLYITNRGLEFEVELPKGAFGDALLEGIRRRDYDSISFAFLPKDEDWSRNEEGIPVRYIKSFSLLDEISILSLKPAYSSTNVNTRSLEKFKEEEAEQERKYQESLDKLEEATNDLNNLYAKYLDIEYNL